MRTLLLFVVLAAVSLPAFARQSSPLKDKKQKVSYGIGYNIGKNFKMQDADVDLNALFRGFREAMEGTKSALKDEEMEALLQEFGQTMQTKMAEKQKVAGDKNKKEGEAFLAANKKKQGVVTLPSGLQYKILKAGTGEKPTKDKTVVCNYRGTLIDGKEFDSSYKRNEPATFQIGQVIPGWQEALQLMPVGSKWQIVVPSNLGYGERGAGGMIEPNSTLVFEIELLSIK